MTISVSEEMYDLIYEGTRSRFYSSVSEYIRFLVRRDQRPDAVAVRKEKFDTTLRTANECIETARRELEAERAARRDP